MKPMMTVVTVLAVLGAGCGMTDDEVVLRPDAAGEVVIDLDEFDFGVDLIELTAGETVTFVLVNAGANEHEFMIGRDLQTTSLGYPNGFEHDFFEGMSPVVDPPGAGMFMGAGMDMGDMDMGDADHAADDMGDMDMGDDMDMDDMGDMDMGDDMDMDDMGDMDMGDDMGDMDDMDMGDDMGDMDDTDMDMDDADHADDDMGDMDMGDADHADDGDGEVHAGFMVVRRAGEIARVTFTVPSDAVGNWQIGCFQGRGAHWDAGMRASLIVREA